MEPVKKGMNKYNIGDIVFIMKNNEIRPYFVRGVLVTDNGRILYHLGIDISGYYSKLSFDGLSESEIFETKEECVKSLLSSAEAAEYIKKSETYTFTDKVINFFKSVRESTNKIIKSFNDNGGKEN